MTRGRAVPGRPISILCLLVLGFVSPGVSADSLVEHHPETVTVVRVVDGDSLVVSGSDADAEDRRVRLIGIDAPELSHPRRPTEYLAVEARDFVARLVEGQEVRLLSDADIGDRDSYGRSLRYVELEDGTLLNETLVRRGFAYAYTRFSFANRDRYRELEAAARGEELGVWADNGIAEIRWILANHARPIEIHATSNRKWAVRYGDFVKPQVGSRRLAAELNQLLGVIADPGEEGLPGRLLSDGYLMLRPADGDSEASARASGLAPGGAE